MFQRYQMQEHPPKGRYSISTRGGTMCSRKTAEVARRREEGWRMFGTWHRNPLRATREAGKRDSLDAIITKWTSAPPLPSSRLRGFGGFCPEVATTKAAVLLSPLAAPSAPEAAASYAEIESSVGPWMEMDHLHFCIPPNDYVTPRFIRDCDVPRDEI